MRDAAILYAMKSLLMSYQLCPAAILLASGACLSALRRRGELSALAALTVSPAPIYSAIAIVALGVFGIAFAADQTILGPAGRRADEITAQRFRLWGDFSTYYGQRQWFRGHDRIFFLREGDASQFRDVSIFQLSDDFRLSSRIDAEAMSPRDGGSWEFSQGSERTFAGETHSELRPFGSEELQLPDPPSTFQILRGRPEQMPWRSLDRQIVLRERVGLPTTNYVLAFHNKLAYPLLGVPAALLAAALALRRGRTGHLTASLLEGVAIVAVLWGTTLVFRAAAASGHLSPQSRRGHPSGSSASRARRRSPCWAER